MFQCCSFYSDMWAHAVTGVLVFPIKWCGSYYYMLLYNLVYVCDHLTAWQIGKTFQRTKCESLQYCWEVAKAANKNPSQITKLMPGNLSNLIQNLLPILSIQTIDTMQNLTWNPNPICMYPLINNMNEKVNSIFKV